MTIESALKKALKVGWTIKDETKFTVFNEHTIDRSLLKDPGIYRDWFLERGFWQALGKSMGFDNAYDCVCSITRKISERNPAFLADCLCHREAAVSWHSEWHRFIGYLMDGKTANEFFATLE